MLEHGVCQVVSTLQFDEYRFYQILGRCRIAYLRKRF